MLNDNNGNDVSLAFKINQAVLNTITNEVAAIDTKSIESAKYSAILLEIKKWDSDLYESFLRKLGHKCGVDAPLWAGGRSSADFPDEETRKFHKKRLLQICRTKKQ